MSKQVHKYHAQTLNPKQLAASLTPVQEELKELDQPDQIVYTMLDDELEQEAGEHDLSVKLDYRKIDERFSANKQTKEIQAYLHNDGTRLTFVRLGMCAYTFQLPDREDFDVEEKAALLYYFESSGV